MSEMKPWGYIHPEVEKILRDKAAYNTCITKKRAGHNTIPLYTAEQLAEAVAAERERCLAAVESARIPTDGWGDPIDDGDCERNEGIDLALEAIRSAAK